MKKVSIITVCYNSEEVITDCLNSVEQQRKGLDGLGLSGDIEIEHIVVDGGSCDATADIARLHPSVDLVISEPDKGLYDAMNKGIDLATGDIITFLNSDDYYTDSSVVRDVVVEFERTDAGGVIGDIVVIEFNSPSKIVRKWKAGPKGSFKNGWMPPHPSLFVMKSVFERNGGFNIDFKFSADYEWMLRSLFAENLSLSFLDRTIVNMRAGGLSNASLKNRLKAHIEDYKAWKVNGLRPYPWTVLLKPLRKITQFI
ncbi:MAG: glycosyl transferase [Bacteroidetes bacterium]|nr:MAG: glycosyl transferase [Bacteroidota bacterium]